MVVYLLTPTSNHNPLCRWSWTVRVVYLLTPTSNHNRFPGRWRKKRVVYLLTPTSNHNWVPDGLLPVPVVYLLTPTSNHNTEQSEAETELLYIFWLLHQTTTGGSPCRMARGCISFDSYIKPQLVTGWYHPEGGCISFDSYIKPQLAPNPTSFGIVVYLLTPTSNHNTHAPSEGSRLLYIFWLLHQTTTYRFENTEFQRITFTFSNKKWWVGYIFQCKSTKKTPIE